MKLIKEKKSRRQRLVDATRKSALFTSTSRKSQRVWKSVKVQIKTILPSTKFWGETEEPYWPEDEEEGLFCKSLLELMGRLGRYDFLEPKSQPLPMNQMEKQEAEVSNGEEQMIQTAKSEWKTD